VFFCDIIIFFPRLKKIKKKKIRNKTPEKHLSFLRKITVLFVFLVLSFFLYLFFIFVMEKENS
jgi:hypothetical protein